MSLFVLAGIVLAVIDRRLLTFSLFFEGCLSTIGTTAEPLIKMIEVSMPNMQLQQRALRLIKITGVSMPSMHLFVYIGSIFTETVIAL